MSSKKKTDAKQYIIIVVTFLLLATLLVILTFFNDRIVMNPTGTIGNTAGNLNNSGLFCEYDGKVYFSNSYDGGSLYSMTVDENGFEKLTNVDVCNILAGGKYLYYFQLGASGEMGLGGLRIPKNFIRCDLDGDNAKGLTRDTVVTAQLVDNYLYMLTGDNSQPSFYKMRIDKSEQTNLADYIINPACAVDGFIYYNGTQSNHYLYRLNTANDTTTEIWAGNLWYPIVDGDYVYYMDVAENYRLCRYSLSQGIVEVLTNDRVDCFNVGNGYIYYQKNGSSPSLNMMYTDGTGAQVIAEGNYTNINMTSRYVYFQEFGNDSTLYHANLGSTVYDFFVGARNAAMENAEE